MAKKRKPPARVVATQVEVAAYFGVSEEAIRKWRKRMPPMPGEPGKWVLADIEAWHEKYVKPQKGGTESRRQSPPPGNGKNKANGQQVPPEVSKKYELETRKLEADVIAKEIALAEAAQRVRVQFENLADLDETNRFLAEFLTWMRDQHTKLVVDMAGGYNPQVADKIRADLQSRLDLILKGARRKLDDLDELKLEPKDLKRIAGKGQTVEME